MPFVRRVKSKKVPKHRPVRKAPHLKNSSRAAKAKRKRKRFRSDKPGTCVIRDGMITWTLPKKLQSLNKLRGWRSRHFDTQSWEKEINSAVILNNDLSIGPHTGKRMRLEVIRLAPNARFQLDHTNAAGGVKGLEDSLIRLGFLVDDSDAWEDGPWIQQGVSSDKKYWTIIRLSESREDARSLLPVDPTSYAGLNHTPV